MPKRAAIRGRGKVDKASRAPLRRRLIRLRGADRAIAVSTRRPRRRYAILLGGREAMVEISIYAFDIEREAN